MDIADCSQLVSEMINEAVTFINEFQLEEACLAMGLCGESAADNLDKYERAFVEETKSEICSTMGPMQAICEQVVRGDITEMPAFNFNVTSANDLFLQCEETMGECVCLPRSTA